jgi:predicted nucleic acid-binding protein
MLSSTATNFTMAEVVLDANILVAWLDQGDSLHARAAELLEALERDGHEPVLLDVLLSEAISVLCRRARERRNPPDLDEVLRVARHWVSDDAVRWVAAEAEDLFEVVIGVIEETAGRLNFNDGLLVALQRRGDIDALATLDRGFEGVANFRVFDS